jgi:hypothetical protein
MPTRGETMLTRLAVAAVALALVPAGAEAHTLSYGEARRAMKEAVKRIEEPRVLRDRMVDFAASYCYRGSQHRISCVAEGTFSRGGAGDDYYCGGRYVAVLKPGTRRARARPTNSGPPVRCREFSLLG